MKRTPGAHALIRYTAWAAVALLPILGGVSAATGQAKITAAGRAIAAMKASLQQPAPGQIIFTDKSPKPSNHDANFADAHYMGYQVCSGCHGRLTSSRPDHTVIDEWSKTAHANDPVALGGGTLNLYTRFVADGNPVVDHNGQPVKKQCMTCHSTGAPFWNEPQDTVNNPLSRQGYDASVDWFMPSAPPQGSSKPANWDVHQHNLRFVGVQCENCHGPGSKHVLSGGNPLYINRVPNPQTSCYNCHVHTPNEKGNILTGPVTIDLISKYSSSLGHTHAAGALVAGTGGFEYPGENYNAGHTQPHTRIKTSCVTCHLPRDPKSPILNHASLDPQISACRNCHGDASQYKTLDDWGYLEARQGIIQALLVQLGGDSPKGSGNPDFNAGGGLLGNALDKTSPEYKAARWNYALVINDSSLGAHNFDYAAELLATSIAHAPAQKP
jgi:Cytochrome c554 and c-prime